MSEVTKKQMRKGIRLQDSEILMNYVPPAVVWIWHLSSCGLMSFITYFTYICEIAVCFLRRLNDSFVTIDSHVTNTMSFPTRNKPLQQSLQNHG